MIPKNPLATIMRAVTFGLFLIASSLGQDYTFIEKLFSVPYSKYVWENYNSTSPFSGEDTLKIKGYFEGSLPWLYSQKGETNIKHIEPEYRVGVKFRPHPQIALTSETEQRNHNLSLRTPGFLLSADHTEMRFTQKATFGNQKPFQAGLILQITDHPVIEPTYFKMFLQSGFYPILTLKAATGRGKSQSPLHLKKADNLDIEMPLFSQKYFTELTTTLNLGAFSLTHQYIQNTTDYFHTSVKTYALMDSGYTSDESLKISWGNKNYPLILGYEKFMGKHTLKAFHADKGIQRHFGYQNIDLAGKRIHLQVDRPSKNKGTFYFKANYSILELDALKPKLLANHYTFEVNNFLDSYQGSLLDVFQGEKYLLESMNTLTNYGNGIGWAKNFKTWSIDLFCMYNLIHFESASILSKTETAYIIFSKTEQTLYNIPKISLHLLIPSLRFEKTMGNIKFQAYLKQALPLYYHIAKPQPSDLSTVSLTESSFENEIWGGTELKTRLEWGW